MNQPTREEFDELVKIVKRIERETEPMRLERRLSIPEANTLQKIMEMVGHHGPDIATIKTKVETQMATKDDLKAIETRLTAIAEVQKLILERLPEKE